MRRADGQSRVGCFDDISVSHFYREIAHPAVCGNSNYRRADLLARDFAVCVKLDNFVSAFGYFISYALG